jgi:hypothetical protein
MRLVVHRAVLEGEVDAIIPNTENNHFQSVGALRKSENDRFGSFRGLGRGKMIIFNETEASEMMKTLIFEASETPKR